MPEAEGAVLGGAGEDPAPPTPSGASAGPRPRSVDVAMVRYYLALFARSQRWLPPVLLYGGALVIDAGGGDYLGDTLGFSAALLLPAVAWLTRAMCTVEPLEIRYITAGVHGPVAARIGALVAAAGYGLLFAAFGLLVAVASSGASAPAGSWSASAGPAQTAVCGILVEVLCVLLGTATGAVAAPPLVESTAVSVLGTGILSLGVAVAPFSPANMCIRALVGTTGSETGTLVVAGPIALALTAVAWYVAGQAAARR
jgi:hypothetical protein